MLKQIKYFLAVVDCNSFTEAAERCFISQSAISQQINTLERELGVKLLKRDTRRFSLTPAGEYLYLHGRGLLEQADTLRKETIRIGRDAEAQLRIGYLKEYDGPELQDAVYEFTTLHPEVVLSIAKGSQEELFHGISQNEMDVVFSYQRRAFSDEYENLHLQYAPCMIEISERNPLAKSEYVRTDQLKGLPCILIAGKEQRESEQAFYQKMLGIGSTFMFVENMSDARMSVLGNRGFFPVADIRGATETHAGIRRLQVCRGDWQPIQINYCAFWKKERSNYYIEEFVSLLRAKLLKDS